MKEYVQKHIKIKEINHGIASRIGNVVYLNKRLREYPKVRDALICHELEHSSGYTFKDIGMDIINEQLKGNKREYYKFILNNPSSWTEYFPFGVYDGKWIFSPTIALIWIFGIFVGWLVIGG